MTAGSHDLFERSQKVLVGGVNSPVRAFGSVGGVPRFIARAEGSRIWDVDGKEYIDYVGSWGPMILGHKQGQVIGAIKQALNKGISFGTATVGEIRLAEKIISMMPNLETVRLVNSGTEATMSAVRLARAYTKRNKIIKFAGCYHGHGDSFLVQAGSGATTLGVPTSPGVPGAVVSDTLIARFNNIGSVRTLLEAYPKDIAAVILEPIVATRV